MKKQLLFIAAGFLASATTLANNKHVHGEGRLEVIIEKNSVSLRLELPLEVAVGFERAPKTDKEKSALAASDKALKDGLALWQFTSAAQCTLQSAQVETPFLAPSSETKASASGKKEPENHADIEASYVFHCAKPAALKGLETTLFRSFKRLYRLEAQRIRPNGQGAGRLTAKQPMLAW